MSVYHDDFSSWKDVQREYHTDDPEPEEVIFASYTYQDYSGDSVVVYRNGSDFFWNEGSHCSCYGLEEQWGPDRYSYSQIMELARRLSKGGNGRYRAEERCAYGAALALLTYDQDQKKNTLQLDKSRF